MALASSNVATGSVAISAGQEATAAPAVVAPVPAVVTVPPPPGSTQTPVLATVPSAPVGSVSASPAPPAIPVPAIFSGVPNYPAKMSPWQLQVVAEYNDARTNQKDYDAIMNTAKLIAANGGPVPGFASNPWTPAYQTQYSYMVATFKAAAAALAGVPRPGGVVTPMPATLPPADTAMPKVTTVATATPSPTPKAAPSTGAGGAVVAAPKVADVVSRAYAGAGTFVQQAEQGINVFVGWLGSIFAKRA